MKISLLLITVMFLNLLKAAAGSFGAIALTDADGNATSLQPYQGQVLLIVNLSTRCGYTPQSRALEALYEKYKASGFAVLGIPCDQFGGQEPSTAKGIKKFFASNYHVTFPIYQKMAINGEARHPLYTALAGVDSPFSGRIRWNFTKFLVGRDGSILNRFEPEVAPDSPQVIQAIVKGLAAK